MNEPKLRFKADGEIPFPDWEKKELSDICELITVGIANSATQAYRDTGVIMFRNQNIKENYLDTSDLIYIDPEFEKRYKKKRLKADDLLIVRTGYPGTACLVPPEYEDAQTFTTLIARLIKNENVPAYVCQYINSPLGKSYFESTQIGGGQKNSGAKILENFPISLPSLPEQQKIAFLFTELDTIIQSAEKELEGYRELKQGMLQKMFPKKGEKVPEIRFPEFTGDWEQCKLGKCAEFNPKSELPDIFEYVDLESVVGTDILSHRTESKSSAPSRAQRLAQKGDVFYQTVRPYQKNNCIFEKDDNNWVFSTGYAQLRPVNNGYFLLTLLQNEDFVKRVLDRCTGTSYPAINSNDLADIDVNIPSDNKEQQKIGAYFKNLDNLIILQQRELDGYKELKKGLLQQMFC